MALDISAIANKAKTGELKGSDGAVTGGGVKLPGGVFTAQLQKAEVAEGFNDKTKRNLRLTFIVESCLESFDIEFVPSTAKGSLISWYFPQAAEKNQEHAERVVGDLIQIAANLGIDADKLTEDAEDIVDIYNNFCSAVAKKLKKGPTGEFVLGRRAQRKDPSRFDHFLTEAPEGGAVESPEADEDDIL